MKWERGGEEMEMEIAMGSVGAELGSVQRAWRECRCGFSALVRVAAFLDLGMGEKEDGLFVWLPACLLVLKVDLGVKGDCLFANEWSVLLVRGRLVGQVRMMA